MSDQPKTDSDTAEEPLEQLERQCTVEFTRGSGPGGQHRNKAETAVRLTHRPTGLVVVASDSRSQAQNRRNALLRLAERLQQIEREATAAQKRNRRKPTRPSPAHRRKRVESKRQQGKKKELRRRVRSSDDEL